MAFTKLEYKKHWTKAEDFPTYQTDEEQVRKDMQYHPDAVKEYINGALLPALADKSAAAELGAVDESGSMTTIQRILDGQAEDIAELVESIRTLNAGGIPMLLKSTQVEFSEDAWSVVGGVYMLTIPKSDHKRDSAAFGYNIYQYVDGTYRSGMWGAASTRVSYSGGSITLTTDEAYNGRIVFFGM